MDTNVSSQAEAIEPDRMFRDDLKLFVGRNPEPFLYFYDQQQSKRSRFNMCWPAFFVPMAWYMYRRMYLYAGFILALGVVIGVVFPKFGTGGTAGISFALASIAKPLYLNFAQRKIDKAGRRATDEADRQRRIAKAGGVSVLGAVIGSIITVLPIIAIVVAGSQR